MMVLRPYQREAVDAVYAFLRARDDNPCVVIPTAGGKTPVMATICRDAVQVWHGRVLILAHVRELLEQAAEKLQLVAPDLPVGVYSAGLKRRDLGYAVTIAGIQSLYQKACDVGAVDLVIVDEAHLIAPDGEGMYRTFLTDMRQINPLVRIIGLTATPFRLRSGTICAPDNILNEVCFEVGVRELIVQGYLCPLRTKAGAQRPDYDQLHVRGGEYVAGEVEALMDNEDLVLSACREIVEQTRDRQSVLIFASGVQHGEHVCQVLTERYQVECGFVCGETLPFQRDETLRRFRAGNLKYLCNVNVLTTGFDAPNIDCVALLRPTLSPGLYYQMVGRGFRLHPGKSDCLVLDYGGNVLRHGPVDAIRLADRESGVGGEAPAKECPKCHALIAAGYAACPECGFEFPERQRSKHEATAGTEAILSGEVTRTEYEVAEVFYAVHMKRDAPPDAPRTMRVEYQTGFQTYVSEWVCFEHQGYPRQKAEIWWRARCDGPVPGNTEEAVERARAGALAPTVAITVEHREGERFDRVVAYRLGDKPAVTETPVELECPNCGRTERSLQPGSGPHAAKEVCAWCGRWLRWVPQAEAEARWLDEVPF
ncbi:MAG: DEAD/DEAH box helicase [Phycisphaerae bacterium]|jgi:DNA repair protein RadD